jgi:hypothetical protein
MKIWPGAAHRAISRFHDASRRSGAAFVYLSITSFFVALKPAVSIL